MRESQSLIIPFGQFKFLLAPYSISSILEHYNHQMDDAFAGLFGYCIIGDDIITYDSDITQHTPHLRLLLQRCAEKWITLNIDKWKFTQTMLNFADWPDIIPMGHNTSTPHLTKARRGSFCHSRIFWSDQGPQFISKLFKEFTRQWGFQCIILSPRYPQNNGKAEATVKPMKTLIRASWTGRCLDEDKLAWALLQYRNTPSWKDGLSPAQKLFWATCPRYAPSLS